MSIATTRGDEGQTSLVGGRRVSKASLRIDAIGAIDELGTHLAFARAICPHPDTRGFIKEVQRQLFAIAEILATEPEATDPPPSLDRGLVDALTERVHRLESIDGLMLDWALPGENVPAAACEMARTTCRRAERSLVRLQETGELVEPTTLAYLNRLADVLWLISRFLEHESRADARLRPREDGGPRWSRAW
jgi:cob(I)alamin adenosyltransferase